MNEIDVYKRQEYDRQVIRSKRNVFFTLSAFFAP